jgi:EPS-associated MarR family transcriptional regulator
MNQELRLKLLMLLEKNPKLTHRELLLATEVSLGSVNFMMKALKEKVLIKWENFSNNPNKLQYTYLITPAGISEKIQLTLYFLKKGWWSTSC